VRVTKVLWPIIIVCSALAALMVMRVFPGLPERPIFIMWFLFICPGMALVRFLHLKELAVKLGLALALSFSIDGIVVGIYLYAGHWSPFAIMLTLTVSSIAAVIIELTNVHVVVYNHVGFIRSFGALLTSPLIIGTSSVKPQRVGGLDVVEASTIQVNSIPSFFASATPMDIEEKPTVQMAKAQFSSAATREVDIGEKPTVQMAKAQFLTAANRDVDVEKKPTMQMAKPQLSSAARERFENQSTVEMSAQFSPAQAPQRAVWSPSEPQTPPVERPHRDNKQHVDAERKDDPHAVSGPATPQIIYKDVDRTVQALKPSSTAENSFPVGDDLEKEVTRHTVDDARSEQFDIDDPDTQKFSEDNTQKFSKDNVDANVQPRLANGEEDGSGSFVDNNPIRRKRRFATQFTRIEKQ
jgi:hypothetical protein